MLLANALGTGLKNLVTGNYHTGSWGLPDLGVTESLQQNIPLAPLLGTTSQGGSNLNPFNNSVTNSVTTAPATNPVPSTVPGAPTTQPKASNTVTNSNTPTFPSQPDSGVNDQLAVINQQYDANKSYFEAQRQSLLTAQPQFEKQINDSYNTSIANLDAQKQQAMDQITGQKALVDQTRQSAISTARNLYNQLIQQGIAKFGAGSSAGPAYAALVGKQTSANIGDAYTASTNALSQIASEQNNLSNQYLVGRQTIEDTYNKNVFAIQQQLKDQLAQISRDESLNEAGRQSQSFQALQSARDQAYNYQLAKAQWEAELLAYTQSQSQNYNNAIAQQLSTLLPQEQIDALVGNIKKANNSISSVSSNQPTGNNLSSIQGYTNLGLSEEQKRLLKLNPLYTA